MFKFAKCQCFNHNTLFRQQEYSRATAMEFLQKVSQQLFEPENADQDNELVVLGRRYEANGSNERKPDEGEAVSTGVFSQLFHRERGWNPEFLLEVHSLLHFTYRTKFEPIPKDPNGPSPMNFGTLFRDNPLNSFESAINHPDCFCSDIGWGCMIRTGQALLGNALARLRSPPEEKQLIGWFEDRSSAPFSLHNFVREGNALSRKPPGEWFGPSATSRSIQSLVHAFPQCGLNHCIISTDSGDVYEEDVGPILEREPQATILLLLGVKLGLNNVNSRYWPDVKHILGSSFSVGIAGGRPSSSLYFFGYQGDYLFYLDPHTSQLDLASCATDNEKYESVHSARFNKVHFSELDPSMLIGVLIQGLDDWDAWKSYIDRSQILHVLPHRPRDYFMDEPDDSASENDGIPGSRDSQDSQGPAIDGDYVDVAPMVQHAGSCRDDEFQDVKCKNQKILVVGDHDSTTADTEIERVLVEHETVPLIASTRP
ncbi:cysteine protease ATG4 [Lachancea thermotolerans CBS 6340]|uniref:Cysteine protease n=1 Tax=Lachancea thermotolerans (strain ATCC 56472 / CBS 6340 / NRRL Y-8284) TaxID=559295 RepID=C5DD48_LACTC|nr:KLTH0B08272p [Lachancea thermotolerans CBS 6340]CAR21709.1 KLTH0B08272p [Lachancea thermotolerans CBS 6340]